MELATFDGTRNNSVSHLYWETDSELNNSHFDVEYSSDGIVFNTVGTVSGQGTTTETHSYQFEHRSSEINCYYRLKQVDFDGTEKHSAIISLEEKINGTQIFPNPVNGNSSLTIRSEDLINSIAVIDAVGQVIYTQHQIEDHYLQLQPIRESGVFIVKVQCADKESVFRIISQ